MACNRLQDRISDLQTGTRHVAVCFSRGRKGQDRTYHAGMTKETRMRKLLLFGAGLAIGYVVGAKGGRKAYDDLIAGARKVWDHPTVQEVAGVVQEQAERLVDEGKRKLS